MSLALRESFIGVSDILRFNKRWDLDNIDVPFNRHVFDEVETVLLSSLEFLDIRPKFNED